MSFIQIRVDEKIKKEATTIFNKLGLDMSTAIKIYLVKVINGKGIPFEITLATDDELKDFHGLAGKSLEFWKDEKDDLYQEFYKKKK